MMTKVTAYVITACVATTLVPSAAADGPPCATTVEQILCIIDHLGDEKQCVGFLDVDVRSIVPQLERFAGYAPYLSLGFPNSRAGIIIGIAGDTHQHVPYHTDFVLFGASTLREDCRDPVDLDDRGMSEYWISIIEDVVAAG